MVDSSLVLSKNGLDILKDNRGDVIQNLAGQNPIMALPLLEYEYQYVLSKLTPAFPFQTLVELALMSQSQHWIALALNWLKTAPLNINSEVLLKVILDKSLPQAIRHQAKKLVYDARDS